MMTKIVIISRIVVKATTAPVAAINFKDIHYFLCQNYSIYRLFIKNNNHQEKVVLVVILLVVTLAANRIVRI